MAGHTSFRTRFFGKTWVFWAQFLFTGLFGVLGIIMGVVASSGLLRDAFGKPRTDAGPPLLAIGGFMLVVAVLNCFNILALSAPLIRCYREGIACNLIGATSLDGIPIVPGLHRIIMLIRLVWAIVSLQGFRTQQLRATWQNFRGAHVEGPPMAHVLILNGMFVNEDTGQTFDSFAYLQSALKDHPRAVAEVLNRLACDQRHRQLLSSWPSLATIDPAAEAD